MFRATRFQGVALALVLLVWGCSSCEPSGAAPGEQWPESPPEEQGFDSDELAAVVERIDEQALPIDSVQVVRNGVLILDAYFYPYLGEQPHDVASVTKSVTSTLIGIAVDQGLLTLDQRVLELFEELAPPPANDGKETIELRHLLTMSSGLDCGRTPGEPELYAMLASDHYVRYALGLPMATAPQTAFAYCSPGSHLLSAAVSEVADRATREFALAYLFGPLGIRESVWPQDPQGVNHGWGDLQLYPRDMARIGHLFLNKGAWNDTQVVSSDWVDEATKRAIDTDAEGTGYGYQWWVLGGDFEGIYEARGRGGQAIIVWPNKRVVAVFTGRGIDVRGEIAPLLAAALESDEALAPNPEGYARLKDAIRAATEPPPAQPVPELPPMASQVSGKIYRVDANLFDVRCVSLRFDSAEDVLLRLTVGSSTFDLPVGMDGVPRFSQSGPTGIPIGVTGRWVTPITFEMQYDEVAGPNHLRIRAEFTAGATGVSLRFTDPAGHFPEQVIAGAVSDACD